MLLLGLAAWPNAAVVAVAAGIAASSTDYSSCPVAAPSDRQARGVAWHDSERWDRQDRPCLVASPSSGPVGRHAAQDLRRRLASSDVPSVGPGGPFDLASADHEAFLGAAWRLGDPEKRRSSYWLKIYADTSSQLLLYPRNTVVVSEMPTRYSDRLTC